MKKITRVSRPMPAIVRRKKVAAYARVSVESERMNHSLSAQISYYNGLIQRNPEWEFAGVYADMYNQRLIQCPAHGSVEKRLK